MNVIRREPLGVAVILLLYFALKPLYLGASGFLQISDVVLLLSLAYLFIAAHGKLGFDSDSASAIRIFLIMLLYQIVINSIWQAVTGDRSMSRHDLYYIFNFMAFTGCLYIGQLVSTDRIKRAVGLGSFVAVIITAMGMVLSAGLGTRSTAFFNNPNQLGYFAVIMLTVIALCKEQLNWVQKTAIFVISFWSMISSLSKAAILAYFIEVVVLILFYQNNRSAARIVTEIALLAVVGMVIYLLFFSDNSNIVNNDTIYQMRERILNLAEENDSSLAYGRGYARVTEMLPHLLWGTGEGAYDRFIVRHGTEVHSTFVMLLTCYGVIGLTGYIAIFKKCMGDGRQFVQNAIVLMGLFLYSLTHNGIRNTLVWMIMAMVLLFSRDERENLEYY